MFLSSLILFQVKVFNQSLKEKTVTDWTSVRCYVKMSNNSVKYSNNFARFYQFCLFFPVCSVVCLVCLCVITFCAMRCNSICLFLLQVVNRPIKLKVNVEENKKLLIALVDTRYAVFDSHAELENWILETSFVVFLSNLKISKDQT